jgi:protein-tyrosine phosphatase
MSDVSAAPPSLLFVCTGNATRSVLAGVLAERDRPGWRVRTAGTFVVEGQPVSWRTRRALESLGLHADGHRGTQMTDAHLTQADLVVALACEHVAYVRRNHPQAAAKTATLRRLAATLPPGPEPLADRLAKLGLADAALDPAWEDVEDPGGQEVDAYLSCAAEIEQLMREALPRFAAG